MTVPSGFYILFPRLAFLKTQNCIFPIFRKLVFLNLYLHTFNWDIFKGFFGTVGGTIASNLFLIYGQGDKYCTNSMFTRILSYITNFVSGDRTWCMSAWGLGIVICFSAPPRPYTMYGGEMSTVWHDRYILYTHKLIIYIDRPTEHSLPGTKLTNLSSD